MTLISEIGDHSRRVYSRNGRCCTSLSRVVSSQTHHAKNLNHTNCALRDVHDRGYTSHDRGVTSYSRGDVYNRCFYCTGPVLAQRWALRRSLRQTKRSRTGTKSAQSRLQYSLATTVAVAVRRQRHGVLQKVGRTWSAVSSKEVRIWEQLLQRALTIVTAAGLL